MVLQCIVSGLESHTGDTIGIFISTPFPFINESLPHSREIKQIRQIIPVPFTPTKFSRGYLFHVSVKCSPGRKSSNQTSLSKRVPQGSARFVTLL